MYLQLFSFANHLLILFEVTVPDECSGQMLRLYSAGHRDVDHELDGAIWFDDLQIGRNQ